jgi:hypothetical protein
MAKTKTTAKLRPWTKEDVRTKGFRHVDLSRFATAQPRLCREQSAVRGLA